MKRFIFFIVVFNSLLLTALGNVSDSLENRLNSATSDTAKVMIYNRIVRDLLTRQNWNLDQALLYAQKGLTLADQVQFHKGRAELHRTIGITWFYLNDYEQAIEHYRQALNICEKLQDMNGMAMNYYNICIIYRAQSKIYNALDVLQKALSLWEQTGNTNYMIIVYRGIIELYRDVDEPQFAVGYAEEALRLAIKTGNRQEEAALYDRLAYINRSMGNEQVVEEYYQKALNIFEELGEQLEIARITVNIAGNLYSNDPKKAIELLRKSIAIYEKISPDSYHLFEIYDALANMFQAKNNDDSTIYYKEKALSKAILSGNAQTMAVAHDSTGNFYLRMGNIDRAEKEFRNAYDVAIVSRLYNMKSRALSGLSLINYQKGNYKTAYDYLQQYQAISDSLSREENKNNIQQLTMQYEFEKDMTEKNEIIKVQLERQQQAIKYQKIVVMIISIALICAAILLGFIFHSNKRNRQANVKLEQQHREILRINEELKESHRELSMYKDNLEKMVKEQTEKLQQSELQLRTLSDNLHGGCIYQKYVFHDGKEVVTYISNTAEEWLGISAETIMDDIDLFYRQILPEDLEKKRKIEQDGLASMSSCSCEYRLMNGDQEVWLLENTMPRIYENQMVVWDGIIVNITDRKKFEKELIEAKEKAEESDRLKSAFLANMSHEIRTPMNGIVGFLGFIEREDLPTEKRKAYINIIHSNVQQLLQLIGDIIDISKIDSNLLTLHQIPFDLNTLLEELEIFFQDFILKRDKKMELMLDRSQFISPCIIQSDPVRLQQVFSNLIGNAVKFTDMGYIRFGYALMEDCDMLHFFVEDTGIGIPEPKQEYIFGRFWQLHDEKSKILYGGTGLGLPISQNLVELMGGQIGVESKDGFGSTFYFTLPYNQITE